MALRVTGRLIALPEDIGLVRRLLPEHIRLSRAEPGCLSFEVVQSDDDPCIWNLDETFADRAAFEAHQARTRASTWGELTKHLGRDFRISDPAG